MTKIMLFLFTSLISITTMLESVQASWCLGTGPGTCNLNIEGTPVFIQGGYKYVEMWTRINIYDHACNPIGYLNNPIKGVAIDSQLPFTIVMTEIQNDDRNFGFCYAGTCHNGGFTIQEFDEGGKTVIEALHAFDCVLWIKGDQQQRTLGSVT